MDLHSLREEKVVLKAHLAEREEMEPLALPHFHLTLEYPRTQVSEEEG